VGSTELLGKVLSIDNMFDVCERVVRNGGVAGVDGMTVEELCDRIDKEVPQEQNNGGGHNKPESSD
jgi:hypothetical protein